MHEYANWHGPLPNRRQRFLEASHLFTQLNDYHILKAGCFEGWSLRAVYFSCIYGSLVAEIGMCKAGFNFPRSRNVFSACFVLSVATCSANAKVFRSITVLFGKF